MFVFHTKLLGGVPVDDLEVGKEAIRWQGLYNMAWTGQNMMYGSEVHSLTHSFIIGRVLANQFWECNQVCLCSKLSFNPREVSVFSVSQELIWQRMAGPGKG